MTPAADLLTATQAEGFARIALANVGREYPGKQDHVLGSARDVRAPRDLHPAFYGSFDWHSCVHMHWLLARLYRLFPALPSRTAIEATFDRHLTAVNIAAECAYFARPESRAFERTYGWAWLLELAREVGRSQDATASRWAHALAPLAAAIAARYVEYLPRQHYALRYGLHGNSAFGLALALDHARAFGNTALAEACTTAATRWFAADRDVPAAWEPSGIDFLSPALMEADLMRRMLPPAAFAGWLTAFLPGLADSEPAALFTPAQVTDRSDGYIVHLDGLNLSRAWNLRGIVAALAGDDARAPLLRHAAAAHLAAGLAGLDNADYGGEHWLATFATLALTTETAAIE